MNKQLTSAKAIAGPIFPILVNACDLTPYKSWNKWRDPFGNILIISKTRGILKPVINKLKPINIKDIYYKANQKDIEQQSQISFSIYCESEIMKWLYGNDNKIRTCLYMGNHWKTIPPLQSDIKILTSFLNNLNFLDKINPKKCRINNQMKQVTNKEIKIYGR